MGVLWGFFAIFPHNFGANAPITKWVTDITYVRVGGNQWLYLCVVVDLYSDIAVGWSMCSCAASVMVR